MSDRAAALNKLTTGDIFHADGANGASLICLVTSVTESVIGARTLTTQFDLTFDRRTGVAMFASGKVIGTIDSTAPLPSDIQSALLGLDRRYRLSSDPDKGRLRDAEKRALIFVATFYPANPLSQSR